MWLLAILNAVASFRSSSRVRCGRAVDGKMVAHVNPVRRLRVKANLQAACLSIFTDNEDLLQVYPVTIVHPNEATSAEGEKFTEPALKGKALDS